MADPEGPPSGGYRALRGGHFRFAYPVQATSASRDFNLPHGRTVNDGFRVATTIDIGSARVEFDVEESESDAPTDHGPTPAPPPVQAEQAPQMAVAPFTPEEARQHQEAWAEHLGVPAEYENSLGMKMVLIPPGEFTMGNSEEQIAMTLKECEEAGQLGGDWVKLISLASPQHKVRITTPFRLAAHETTVGQFRAFVEATGYETEAETDGKGGMGWAEVDGEKKIGQRPEFNWRNWRTEQTDQHAVVNVSWNDALSFCQWLGEKEGGTCQLPTEAQWEYACRSGSTTRWVFGENAPDFHLFAWLLTLGTIGGDDPQTVGQKLPNHFGIFDMHGNVREWCSDWYVEGYYHFSPMADPKGPPVGNVRVVRGGAYFFPPDLAMSASRDWYGPSNRCQYTGFRVASTIEVAVPRVEVDVEEPKAEAPMDDGRTPAPSPAEAEQAPAPAVAPFTPEEAKKHQQAWADYLGVPVEFENSTGIQMVLIPPGEFIMGSTSEEQTRFLKEARDANDQWALDRIPSEGPQHRVRISRPFYLGKYEVTQSQWQAVMGNNPSKFADAPTQPVEQVSWDDVQPLLEKLNQASGEQGLKFVLPTEAQWEYACRAGTSAFWHGADSEAALEESAWFDANSSGTTHPVGQLKPNAWGLYDMHGNVWEWCADLYGAEYYAQSPSTDPSGPSSGFNRVHRGGGWNDHARGCRSAFRNNNSPDIRYGNVGLRLASVFEARVGAEASGQHSEA